MFLPLLLPLSYLRGPVLMASARTPTQVGEIYLYKEQELLNTSEIIIHPYFNSFNKRFDLVLLELTILLNYVWPVCLPEDNLTFNSNDQCWLTGWGNLDNVPLQPPYQQNLVKIPIQDDKTCEKAYRKKVHDRNKTKTTGDSGGRLVC